MTRPRAVDRFRGIACVSLAAAVVTAFAPALAHDGPEQVIAALTGTIQRRGPSPELLYRRACEFRVLGRLEPAEADLAAAVALDPTHFAAGLELARMRAALGRSDEARVAIEAAEPFASSAAEKAACRMVRCGLARSAGDLEEAAAECDAACRLVPGEAEWVLLRSRLQGELGRHDERVRDLAAAGERNPSAAIAVELIEARIDAARYAEVLPAIEAELAASGWRASWLLRRARALNGLGREGEARDDLRAAVEEVDGRLDPGRPDAGLLAERGLALALLGEVEAARGDLEAARAHGAGSQAVKRIERCLSTGPGAAD